MNENTDLNIIRDNVLIFILVGISIGICSYILSGFQSTVNFPTQSITNESYIVSSRPYSFYLNAISGDDITVNNPKIVYESVVITNSTYVLVDGVDYTINYNTGLVTIS
jgi:hypothetical protein